MVRVETDSLGKALTRYATIANHTEQRLEQLPVGRRTGVA